MFFKKSDHLILFLFLKNYFFLDLIALIYNKFLKSMYFYSLCIAKRSGFICNSEEFSRLIYQTHFNKDK